MSARHLWNPEWQTTYCGKPWGVDVTTTLVLYTCSECFGVHRLAAEISHARPEQFLGESKP